MDTNLMQWLDEEAVDSLPQQAEIAKDAKKASSDFRFAFGEADLIEVIRRVTDTLQGLDTRCKKLALRSFYIADDPQAKLLLDEMADLYLIALAENADFLSMLARSSKIDRLLPMTGSSFAAEADRLSTCYAKHLLPLLKQEKTLIANQMQLLEEISLSSSQFEVVKAEVRQLLQSPSRDTRARAYHSLIGQISKHKEAVEENFLLLHTLRRSLGDQAGFASFYEYATRRSGLADRSQIQRFRQHVQKHIAPLLGPIRAMQWERLGITRPQPWDTMYPAPFGVPILAAEAHPLEKTYLESLRFIFTAKVPLFETMTREGALAFHVSGAPNGNEALRRLCIRDASPDVLSAYFPEIDQSFLLIAQVPQEMLARRLFSATGSLLFDHSTKIKRSLFLPSCPVCPVRRAVSHSMAFLSQRAWMSFYGNMTKYAREYDLTELVLRLPIACALDEMEEFLARARVSNMAVFRHAWREIASRYKLAGTQADTPDLIPVEDAWLFSPMLWREPLTDVFDAMAAVSVLGTLPMGQQHQRLEACFTHLLNNEDKVEPFARLADAGYPSSFEEETVMKAAFAIADFLGL
ncbi:MAG TPA: hypothetical protein VFD19_01770 [Clostridia bacterium]|nr:hypothetical protein [Clostridia bacterium]